MEKFIYCDLDLCVGCGACAVACMDENDVNLAGGDKPNRRIYQVEQLDNPDTAIQYVSAACMHCEDSPCIMGCPTGAISRDKVTRAVVVTQSLCIGCHSCALACPFGVPRYDREDKMTKCDLCTDRMAAGLNPACVQVCPFSALRLMSPDEAGQEKEGRWVARLLNVK